MKNRRFFALLVACVAIFPALTAQTAIEKLKNGVLVVRLESDAGKIRQLEEMLEAPGLTDLSRKRIEAELQSSKEEMARHNALLTKAFQENYTFSEYVFMVDSSSIALKRGARTGIFFGGTAPTPDLGGRFVLVASMGGGGEASGQTLEDAVVVLDDQLAPLQRPFPYYADLTGIEEIWWQMRKGNEEGEAYIYAAVVAELDRKLNRYWVKTTRARE